MIKKEKKPNCFIHIIHVIFTLNTIGIYIVMSVPVFEFVINYDK